MTKLIWGDPLADGQMGKRGSAKSGEGRKSFKLALKNFEVHIFPWNYSMQQCSS